VVLAVDGSRAEIPNSAENRQTYGESANKYGKAVARANVSMLYDVYNRFILDIGMYDYGSGEIAEGKWHIDAVKAIVAERPTLMLFDRNYVSLDFIDCLERAGIKYLIRLRKGDYKAEIKELTGEDAEMEIAHTRNRLEYLKRGEPERACAEKGKTRARIIKMKFGGGKEGALITNMSECEAWELKGLYRKR
jgi:hypothetical protein